MCTVLLRPDRLRQYFLQHVIAADGFDDFLFGVLAIILIVVVVVAFGAADRRCGEAAA